ncbi:hypothetical protein [Sporomusa acidovorans]|uniref:Uncharacterized protein n=1 Tax=Sporomusa acidovorans (strain ATCC 49682 / DSM 3132 / Mol) TaxID=1123286 RepID=A0ABZ3J8G1_SPOA4|nr:hypothetical protein [Sporomusa acidovorans]OZC16023.1 hypothetical protein SPACI_43890 [Sporomusa acidovorans DSM 3132]SDD89341.1 hypothetical protein SAMN04488499_1005108 [Sporomusa acidovorans]
MANNIQEDRLKNYLDAERKTLLAQEYQDGSKKNRRADLNQISEGINELLAGGIGVTVQPGGRSRRVIFRD